MVDTPESAIQRLSIIANKNFGTVKRLLYGQLDSVNVRSGGILLEQLLGGPLPQTPVALGRGLNLTSDFMGYYDGQFWQSYIKSDGKFYFGGNANNYILWDGVALSIGGNLDAVSGTFNILGAGNFPAGSRVLLGRVGVEPLFEMYDAADTLRVRIEKDRLSFYTEMVPAVGATPAIPSVYAGVVQGLYWNVGGQVIPEVRVETPFYSNFISIDSRFVAKYARLATVASSHETLLKLVASNRWASGGDISLPNAMSVLQLDRDITLETEFGNIVLTCGAGSVLSSQRLVLNSNTLENHLEIRRFNALLNETYVFKLTHESTTKAAAFIIEQSANKFIFYIGVEPIMQIDRTGGGVGGTRPIIRMWSDLTVQGNITFGGWA